MKHEVLHVNMGEVSLEIMNENDGNLWQKSKKVQRHHVWSIIQKACCCKDGQHLPTVPSSSSGTPPMYTESSISSADLGTLQLPRWPHLKKKACKFAGKHHAKRPLSGLAWHWFQTSVVRSYPNSRFWNGPKAAQELQHTDLMQLKQIHLATVDSQLPRTNSPLPGAIPLEKCDPLHCPGAIPKPSKAAGSPRFGWGG